MANPTDETEATVHVPGEGDVYRLLTSRIPSTRDPHVFDEHGHLTPETVDALVEIIEQDNSLLAGLLDRLEQVTRTTPDGAPRAW